jgi:hypothetical protein
MQTNQNVFSKIYFSDCIKIKHLKKKSGFARFSGTGGDDHQFLFFMWPYVEYLNRLI